MPTLSDIHISTLARLGGGQNWQLELAHSRPDHLLIWTTRGQGRVLVNGQRRGLGAHNAIWLPAGTLHSLELGQHGGGFAVFVPVGTPLRLPEAPRHLRLRDAISQNRLTGLIEAAQREQDTDAPLRQDALEAHAALISVFLRRQIMREEHAPPRRNAAARLSAAFCAMVADSYTTGNPMAHYARQLGVTPTHLTRTVKATTGRTAAELLTERQLHAARTLLRDSDAPARAIAAHLGFGSAAYFTRFMQQHTGQPPSRLRGAAMSRTDNSPVAKSRPGDGRWH